MTEYKRNCPKCNAEIIHKGKYAKHNLTKSLKRNDRCRSCAQKENPVSYWQGKSRDKTTKEKISKAQIGKIVSEITRNNMSISHIQSWKNPTIREKMIAGSKWVNVKTDKGQIEFIKLLNERGYMFVPNYQVKEGNNLFYVDGYDKTRNVVFEYDSKYHNRRQQKEKDLLR